MYNYNEKYSLQLRRLIIQLGAYLQETNIAYVQC